TDFLAVSPGPFRASASRRDFCLNSKCSCPVTNQRWQCHGHFMAIKLRPRSSWSDHSFPGADLAFIATSDSTLIPRTTADGLPGCQTCVAQDCLLIRMAVITTKQFGLSIALAKKQQRRVQRKI